jgi:outer membrane protein W
MRRALSVLGMGVAVVAGLAVAPVSASAQVVQSINISAGMFMPRAEDARIANDVWLANLPVFRFEIKDFTAGEVSGEWNFAFGDRVELGLGGAFNQRTVPTLYRDYVNKDQSEIQSAFKLRKIPATAVIRLMPFGRPGQFQPYIGGGLNVTFWNYSEVGDFIDFNDNFNVYHARYLASGTSTGMVALAGFRAPIHGDVYALTMEGRYMTGEGSLNTNDFLDSKIDLGGTSLRIGFLIRF